MKRMNIRLFLACICLFAGISAFAYDVCQNGIYFNISGDEATVTYGDAQENSYSGEVVIPCKVKGYPVTRIGAHAFSHCPNLTSVTIPTFVTRIEGYAFEDCPALKEVKCYAVFFPETSSDSFVGGFDENLMLYVPERFLYEYGHSSAWEKLVEFRHIDLLHLEDRSPGADFTFREGTVYIGERMPSGSTYFTTITCPDVGQHVGLTVPLSCTYNISSYGIKDWCEISDEAHATISWINATPEAIGVEIRMEDEAAEVKAPVLTENDDTPTADDGSAPDACIDGIYYIFSGDEAKVTYGDSYYNSYSGDVVVPCYVTHADHTYEVTTIGESAFFGCPNLTSLTFSHHIRRFERSAIEECPALTAIYSYMVTSPESHQNSISYEIYRNATLYIQRDCEEIYRSVFPWNLFDHMEYLDIEYSHEAPQIILRKGELNFRVPDGDTDCYSTITCSDVGTYGDRVELDATYLITAFSVKDWGGRSRQTRAQLCWINAEPELTGFYDTTPVEEVEAQPVLIQSQGSTICVDGAPEGTTITLYSTDGKQLDTTVASKGQTSLDGSCLSGSIAIVKIGDRAIKAQVR